MIPAEAATLRPIRKWLYIRAFNLELREDLRND